MKQWCPSKDHHGAAACLYLKVSRKFQIPVCRKWRVIKVWTLGGFFIWCTHHARSVGQQRRHAISAFVRSRAVGIRVPRALGRADGVVAPASKEGGAPPRCVAVREVPGACQRVARAARASGPARRIRELCAAPPAPTDESIREEERTPPLVEGLVGVEVRVRRLLALFNVARGCEGDARRRRALRPRAARVCARRAGGGP